MDKIRQTAVAGSFYPSNPARLRILVDDYLEQAAPGTEVPRAIIAPHAGYMYSGPVAASAYVRLRSAAQRIKRVVLLGPSHRVAFNGLALSSADRYASPLGPVSVDRESTRTLSQLRDVQVRDDAHVAEHSLEVHLPFLQQTLGDFELVPIVTGQASAKEVSQVLERIWDDTETLIVISSDLSHYHDYATARKLDRKTSEAIEALDSDGIGPESACGQVAINGLLHTLRTRKLQPVTIDLRNSGDTAGCGDRVVGYGAYVVG